MIPLSSNRAGTLYQRSSLYGFSPGPVGKPRSGRPDASVRPDRGTLQAGSGPTRRALHQHAGREAFGGIELSQCVRVAKEVIEIWNGAMLRGARAGTEPAAAMPAAVKVSAVHTAAVRVMMCGLFLLHLG